MATDRASFARKTRTAVAELGTSARVCREALRIPDLRRVELAFVGFNMAEWAVYIAIAVYAYGQSGARGVGLVSAIQLIPAAVFAPFASVLGDRYRREAMLLVAYGVQVATIGATAVDATPRRAGTCRLRARRGHRHRDHPRPAGAHRAAAGAHSLAGRAHGRLRGRQHDRERRRRARPCARGRDHGGVGARHRLRRHGRAARRLVHPGRTGRHHARRRPYGRPTGHVCVREALAGFELLRRDRRAGLVVGVLGAELFVLGILDVVIVVLAFELFDSGESGTGFLSAAVGVGGLIGSAATIALIARRRLYGPLRGGMLLYGAPIALIAAAPVPGLAVPALAAAGAGISLMDVTGRLMLQRLVPDQTLARAFGVLEGAYMAAEGIGAVVGAALVTRRRPGGDAAPERTAPAGRRSSCPGAA